ncbi:MAG: Flp pilus assembly protein CpaB [Deltaproteobacteria bacterium]|nr:Flp pilus assembly protein CpaB [Deltaproteobacteria bacterium]
MKRRSILLLSGCLALLAIVLMQAWKARIARDLGFYGEGTSIVVAVRDLPVGSVLAEGDVQLVPYPERYMPPRAVPASSASVVVGQTLGITVKAGQAILHTDWAADEELNKLSQRIPASLRGLALRVDNVSTFGGLLKPGDRVDIVVTWSTPDHVVETRTLLQNVAVAAVGGTMADGAQRAGSPPRGSRAGTVTVVVNAKEAEMLIFAEKQGEVTLTLHRDKDVSVAQGLTRTTWFDESAVKDLQEDRQKRPKDCVTILKANRGTETICG